jgi:hypothetical protein
MMMIKEKRCDIFAATAVAAAADSIDRRELKPSAVAIFPNVAPLGFEPALLKRCATRGMTMPPSGQQQQQQQHAQTVAVEQFNQIEMLRPQAIMPVGGPECCFAYCTGSHPEAGGAMLAQQQAGLSQQRGGQHAKRPRKHVAHGNLDPQTLQARTPLEPKTLRLLGQVKVKRLQKFGVRTVEDLAVLNDTDDRLLAMNITKNKRPDLAVKTLKGWRDVAIQHLRLQYNIISCEEHRNNNEVTRGMPFFFASARDEI